MPASPLSPDFTGSGVIVTVPGKAGPHAIEIPAEDWRLILSGAGMELEGEDFVQAGEDFETEWDFSGGPDGRLEVRCSLIDEDEWSTIFSGTLAGATIGILP
jgi:hypothetical protein